MNKFQQALKAHPDYEAYLNGAFDLVIIDDEACDFLLVPTAETEAEDNRFRWWEPENCEEDYACEDWVDESNYDPYSGCDVFECYNED